MVPIVLSPCCHSTILSQYRVASSQAMPPTSCSVNNTNKSKVNEERIILTRCFLQFQRILLTAHSLQREAPYHGHLTKFFIRQPRFANLIKSRASLKSSYGYRLNTVAWLVELTYLHMQLPNEIVSLVATVRRVALQSPCLVLQKE